MRVNVQFTFTPTGGAPSTRARSYILTIK